MTPEEAIELLEAMRRKAVLETNGQTHDKLREAVAVIQTALKDAETTCTLLRVTERTSTERNAALGSLHDELMRKTAALARLKKRMEAKREADNNQNPRRKRRKHTTRR